MDRYEAEAYCRWESDLGTLVPFLVGYLAISRLDPGAVLFGFGLVSIATRLSFRTPMPVQPMKESPRR